MITITTIQVTVYRAQDLKKVQLIGKQDPYVRATLLYQGKKVCVRSLTIDKAQAVFRHMVIYPC